MLMVLYWLTLSLLQFSIPCVHKLCQHCCNIKYTQFVLYQLHSVIYLYSGYLFYRKFLTLIRIFCYSNHPFATCISFDSCSLCVLIAILVFLKFISSYFIKYSLISYFSVFCIPGLVLITFIMICVSNF